MHANKLVATNPLMVFVPLLSTAVRPYGLAANGLSCACHMCMGQSYSCSA